MSPLTAPVARSLLCWQLGEAVKAEVVAASPAVAHDDAYLELCGALVAVLRDGGGDAAARDTLALWLRDRRDPSKPRLMALLQRAHDDVAQRPAVRRSRRVPYPNHATRRGRGSHARATGLPKHCPPASAACPHS